MNKKQLKKIKESIKFNGSDHHKQLLRQIKKQYKNLSEKQKIQFLAEVKEFFDKQDLK